MEERRKTSSGGVCVFLGGEGGGSNTCGHVAVRPDWCTSWPSFSFVTNNIIQEVTEK